EAERFRRFQAPANDGEREEAPPFLLRDMWLDLLEAGRVLGIPERPQSEGTDSYESETYERIYARLLGKRHFESLPIDEVLSTRNESAYDFDFPVHHLLPSAEEAERFIHEAEVAPVRGHWWEV